MLNKLVIENLKHRPVRTSLSIIAIGVEVTMMLTVVGLSHGMLEDSQRRARGAGADVWVRPPGSAAIGLSSAPMSEKILDYFRKQEHVALASGSVSHPIGGINTVTGLDLDEFTRMAGGLRYIEGGPFQGPDEIIVDERYARQNGVRAGDTMELLNRPWRVSGVMEAGKLARLIVPLRTLQDLTGNTGKLTQAYLKLDDPQNTDKVVANLKEKLKDYQIYSIEEFTSLFSPQNVPGLEAFIGVIIGLSVVVGFLVVFLSLYTAVLERTREIGILKSLGASPAYVLNVLLRETALLAVVGTALGILLTYGTRWAVMTFVPASLTQNIVPGWWPIAAAIALVGALLGAAYPGWKAANQDPIEALAYE
ncbi:MAG: ABC transporter permease [Bryobacteraceae bacterium]|nr:ABC transporter permease [Bryobacteraceae bacterium]